MALPGSTNMRLFIVLGVIGLFGIVTFILVASTLGTLNRRLNRIESKLGTTAVTTPRPDLNAELADTIRIEDLMEHLKQFQTFADSAGHNRAIGTPGFFSTLNYIEKYLKDNAPGVNVSRETFEVKNFTVKGNPQLVASINGTNQTFIYSSNLSRSEFAFVNYSAAIPLKEFTLVVIPENGCSESNWANATGKAALILAGGICTYAEKGELAAKFNAAAILFYNQGTTTSNLAPTIARLRQANTLPALFLSYSAGALLAKQPPGLTVFLEILLEDYPDFGVDNICADIPGGNSNEIIILGSHSDSVPAGPGINDNGSSS